MAELMELSVKSIVHFLFPILESRVVLKSSGSVTTEGVGNLTDEDIRLSEGYIHISKLSRDTINVEVKPMINNTNMGLLFNHTHPPSIFSWFDIKSNGKLRNDNQTNFTPLIFTRRLVKTKIRTNKILGEWQDKLIRLDNFILNSQGITTYIEKKLNNISYMIGSYGKFIRRIAEVKSSACVEDQQLLQNVALSLMDINYDDNKFLSLLEFQKNIVLTIMGNTPNGLSVRVIRVLKKMMSEIKPTTVEKIDCYWNYH